MGRIHHSARPGRSSLPPSCAAHRRVALLTDRTRPIITRRLPWRLRSSAGQVSEEVRLGDRSSLKRGASTIWPGSPTKTGKATPEEPPGSEPSTARGSEPSLVHSANGSSSEPRPSKQSASAGSTSGSTSNQSDWTLVCQRYVAPPLIASHPASPALNRLPICPFLPSPLRLPPPPGTVRSSTYCGQR